MTKLLGNVKSLWRYPVKSMLGEQCDILAVNQRGVKGDRLFAIRDANGKFGSGKNTRRFRRIDSLLAFQSSYQHEIPIITFPDNRVMQGDEPTIHTALSETLGQPVTLAKEAAVSHLDDSPIHILTTASLAWLQKALPDSVIDEKRFRANVILELRGNTPVEHNWIGRRIQVGNEVTLEVTKLAERCVMTSSEQKDLPHDPKIFRHIVQQSETMLGVYANVVTGGVVKLSDDVNILH